MGRRADAVLIYQNVIYVIEFKVGAKAYQAHDLRQTHGYAIDLHHFHEGSHNKTIVPLLVATDAHENQIALSEPVDHVYPPLCVCAKNLQGALAYCNRTIRESAPIDFQIWFKSAYKPTPTIVEAAQALYANHDVADIARNDAGAHNLHVTSSTILDIVHKARIEKQKAICFVTGVPGAGKTLVGLNIATTSVNIDDDEHAVFLSGNGPLVEVLTEALARDAKERDPNTSKEAELRKAAARIQNIHRFRDEALLDPEKAPPDRVVIFDEAQRAWDAESTARFMTQKRGQKSFEQSEPEFLISFMDRHPDWCVIIALIGGGQEINTGEAGLNGWIDAIRHRFTHWHVYYSDKLKQGVIASSGGARLKPDGIFVKNKISAADWFLNDPDDVRSCHFLEDVATEFDIQGLELDWCLIGWDADYRYIGGVFEHWKFTGSSWKQRNRSEQKRYLENAYRVLLTRARQGMAIFIPLGEPADPTRPPRYYDETYEYLISCGVAALE